MGTEAKAELSDVEKEILDKEERILEIETEIAELISRCPHTIKSKFANAKYQGRFYCVVCQEEI